jgi:alpha-L-fucosidase
MSSRRVFLRTAAGTAAALAAGPLGNVRAATAPGVPPSATPEPLPPPALPSPAQRAWQDLEVGMFVHFAPNTWQEQEYDDRSTPLAAIDPDIDTDQWVETATGLGARYVVLVAKHVGGFCLWQTETTEYSVRNTPWRGGRGDVMADLAASCARRGIRLGVYLSPRDDSQGAANAGRCADADRQAAYDTHYRQQLTELLTRYGPIVELWLDGSSVVPTGDLVHRYAPDAMVFQGPQATIRWVGNEDGFAPYPAWNSLARADAATGIATALHGDPAGDAWMPLEVDVSLRRPNWFWSTTNHRNLLSVEQLLEIYYRSVGRGAQLLLNVTPDRTGHVPAADAARLREFGDEVRRRFGAPVAEISGAGPDLGEGLNPPLAGAPFHDTRGGRRLVLPLADAPRRVDHVVIQEDVSGGERVRGYRLEALVDGAWTLLGTGSAVGHKRIHPVGPIAAAAIRLDCTETGAPPLIRRLAAYDTGAAPPPTWAQQAQLWADDAVGAWADGRCDVDLTSKIPAASQYRLRFVGAGGEAVSLASIALTVGGTRQPHLVRAAPRRRDVLLLTIPGLGQPVVIRARVRGAARGTLLLQRM